MKYTIGYTKTYHVEIDANDPDHAIEIWEDMDLDAVELSKGPAAEIQNVAWIDENGKPQAIYPF